MTQPVEYDDQGRMKYHPDYHRKHKKPWSYVDEQYLIENYALDGPAATSLALERTIGVVMSRVCELRKEGKMSKRIIGSKKHKRDERKNNG